MSLSVWLDGGHSMPPEGNSLRMRFVRWLGRRLALRHRAVSLGQGCSLSPSARIHPRHGLIQLGAHCIIAPGAVLQGNITMGDNCSVQAYSVLVGGGTAEDQAGVIRIGNHVRIAPQVMMIASNHVFDDPDIPICKQGSRHAPITIEDDVWVAGRVNIVAGVTIGRGSVIAAGAVVTKDIPPYSVAAGVPARVIKSRRPQGD